MATYILRSNKETAKKLKAEFSELLGIKVLLKSHSAGSMKWYYELNAPKSQKFTFTEEQAVKIKEKMVELGARNIFHNTFENSKLILLKSSVNFCFTATK